MRGSSHSAQQGKGPTKASLAHHLTKERLKSPLLMSCDKTIGGTWVVSLQPLSRQKRHSFKNVYIANTGITPFLRNSVEALKVS